MAPIKDNATDKKTWQICLSFGLTIGIAIYILGFLCGGWLDERYGTAPLYTVIGALLAIGSSFARLIKNFHDLEHSNKKPPPSPEAKEK